MRNLSLGQYFHYALSPSMLYRFEKYIFFCFVSLLLLFSSSRIFIFPLSIFLLFFCFLFCSFTFVNVQDEEKLKKKYFFFFHFFLKKKEKMKYKMQYNQHWLLSTAIQCIHDSHIAPMDTNVWTTFPHNVSIIYI